MQAEKRSSLLQLQRKSESKNNRRNFERAQQLMEKEEMIEQENSSEEEAIRSRKEYETRERQASEGQEMFYLMKESGPTVSSTKEDREDWR